MDNYQTELREKILADDTEKIIHAFDELDGLRDELPEDAAEAITTLLAMSPAAWDAYAQSMNTILEPNRRKPFTAVKSEDLDVLETALKASDKDGRARNLLAGVRAERNARFTILEGGKVQSAPVDENS